MDSWQRPIHDVGAVGKNGGRGGKYLLLPPGYQGDVPSGFIPAPSSTYQGFSILRPIIADASAESLQKAATYTQQVKLWYLDEGEDSATTQHVDFHDRNYEGITTWNASYFAELSQILNEEHVNERDVAMLGLAAALDVVKGKQYHADVQRTQLLDEAAAEAHQLMIHLYHEVINAPFYPGTHWTGIVSPPARSPRRYESTQRLPQLSNQASLRSGRIRC